MIKVTYYHSPNVAGICEIMDSRIIPDQRVHSAEYVPYLCLCFDHKIGQPGAIATCTGGKIELEYVD